jgi:uncharacterized membrane protein
VIVVQVFLWLMVYSFIGWLYESALRSVLEKKLVDSGLLTGPVCPIYGFGALLVIFCLYRRTDNLLLIFVFSMLLTCSVEYITSLILEKLFHAKWWDYSHMRFNFQGRVSLVGAVVFGGLSVLLIKFVHPFVVERLEWLPEPVLVTAAAILFAALMTDTFFNVRSLLRLDGRLKEIQVAFSGFVDDYGKKADELKISFAEKSDDIKNAIIDKSDEFKMAFLDRSDDRKTTLFERFQESEFYSERIQKIVRLNRIQMKRIARAFPRFKHIHYDEAWQRLKSLLLDAGKK